MLHYYCVIGKEKEERMDGLMDGKCIRYIVVDHLVLIGCGSKILYLGMILVQW
jgi:hypothetical protein